MKSWLAGDQERRTQEPDCQYNGFSQAWRQAGVQNVNASNLNMDSPTGFAYFVGTRDTVAMRPNDFKRLSEPYPDDPPSAGARGALGLELPRWTALQTEILADFTEQLPYGIGWWVPGPGTTRRILIADQLYCCATSVADNMIEGALHWLEFL